MIDILSWITGIATGVIGNFLYGGISKKYKKIIESKSPYSGKWRSRIYNESGDVIKEDELILRENHGKIRGEMKRIVPTGQNREWIVSGYIKNTHMLLAIVAKNETQASDGSVYVIHKEDGIYDGFYLKKVEKDDKKQEIEKIRIRLELQKGK